MRRLGVLGLVVAVTAGAQPYDYLPFRMISTAQNPFPYWVDTRVANPAGVAVDSMRAAADRSWLTWNAVQCAAPKVLSQGGSVGVIPNPKDPYDAYSVTPVWLTSTQDPDFGGVFGSGLTASLSQPVSYAGVLITCDTYFNGATLQWSADAVTPRLSYDVETVMLHEAGHCLGLSHLGGGNIMYFSVEAGKNQHGLGPDDMLALCGRNPSATDKVGSPCGAGDTCSGGLTCMLQPTQNGVQLKLCTAGCTLGSNGGCPLPMTCQPSTGIPGFTGACQLPGSSVTQVGKPCTGPGPTQCGSANALCTLPVQAPSGGKFWANGYCTQSCEPGQPQCPAGSSCFALDANTHRCMQSCRIGLADCRPEYACLAITPPDAGQPSATAGVCIPRCYGDPDCADSAHYTCRSCDGLCVSRGYASGQLGDGCTDDSTCGQGQICRTVVEGKPRICTQQCARGCGMCPQSSTCTPMVGGDLFCLKDCTGPLTCPTGLRCADTINGKGCIPACDKDLDCAVGQHCYQGECYASGTDAGCGALCEGVDSGSPIVVTRKDGGTGGGGNGGCGCGALEGVVGWLGLLFLAGRRRRA